jgi:hypothetical protein
MGRIGGLRSSSRRTRQLRPVSHVERDAEADERTNKHGATGQIEIGVSQPVSGKDMSTFGS